MNPGVFNRCMQVSVWAYAEDLPNVANKSTPAEKGPNAVGSHLLWARSHSTDSSDSTIWRRAKAVEWPYRHYLLIAMLAMVVTVSYGRTTAIYPSADSVYTYVGRAINPHLGFMVGRAMLLNYILQPLLNMMWISVVLQSRYIYGIPSH